MVVIYINFQGEALPHTDNALSPHTPPVLGNKGYDLRDTRGWMKAKS